MPINKEQTRYETMLYECKDIVACIRTKVSIISCSYPMEEVKKSSDTPLEALLMSLTEELKELNQSIII